MHDRRALVRRPSPYLEEGLVTFVDRVPIDLELATQQWENYVSALQREGWETIEAPPVDICPDSVFVEDTAVMYGDLAVIARPAPDERRPEVIGTAEALRDLGYRTVSIDSPGTLEGGDVLKHAGAMRVGLSDRTNSSGFDQLRAHLNPLGVEVTGVPMKKALHLKSAVSALPDGTIVGWDPLVDDPYRWPSYLSVPEAAGAHIVVLDENTVLISTSALGTAALLQARGLRTILVDVSEFEKLEGSVSSLSIRLRHTP